MEIIDSRIERLKREAKQARDEDYQTGYKAGAKWARVAVYVDLRAVYEAQMNHRLDDLNPLINPDGGPSEFDYLIGWYEGADIGLLVEGFIKAVRDFINAAMKKGVPF
jgi:hypothetical protein